MIHDQKSVEPTLSPSRALLHWITLIHVLSILVVLFLGLFLGLHPLITAVLLLVISVGFFYGYRGHKKVLWYKIIFDDGQWSLIPSDLSLGSPAISSIEVELCHYYRFGNSWILSFRELDRTLLQKLLQGRITILLLPDGCDKHGLRQIRQRLLTKN